MIRKLLQAYAILFSLLFSSLVHAIDPHSINLGGAKLTPRLTITQVTDSNIYLSNDDLEESQSSKITIINPSFDFAAKDQDREFYSNFSITSGRYSETRAGDDDYTDYRFSVGSKVPMANRQTIVLNAGRNLLHDNRGAAFTAGAASSVNEPDEYKSDNFGVNYNIGDGKSKMRFELGIQRTDKEYTNNETTTGTRNFSTQVIDSAYYFRTQSKVETFVQVSTSDIDYRIDNPLPGLPIETFDGKQHSGFVGLSWKATAKTTGTIKAGATEKTFDDASIDDIDAAESWLVDITYQPTQRARINLGSNASLSENEGTGTAKESKSYSASWNQSWPYQLSSTLAYSLNNDLHNDSDREDDTADVNFKLTYNFRRWMDINLSYTTVNRESTLTEFEYDKQVYQISVISSL